MIRHQNEVERPREPLVLELEDRTYRLVVVAVFVDLEAETENTESCYYCWCCCDHRPEFRVRIRSHCRRRSYSSY